MKENGILRFGVIGAGRIGKIHAENLANRVPCVEVVAIADIDQKSAHETAARLRIPTVLADYHEMSV